MWTDVDGCGRRGRRGRAGVGEHHGFEDMTAPAEDEAGGWSGVQWEKERASVAGRGSGRRASGGPNELCARVYWRPRVNLMLRVCGEAPVGGPPQSALVFCVAARGNPAPPSPERPAVAFPPPATSSRRHVQLCVTCRHASTCFRVPACSCAARHVCPRAPQSFRCRCEFRVDL